VCWEELDQRFLDTGWNLDYSFEGYALIGHDGYRISLLAHKEWWDPDDPTFELIDHKEMTTCWVHDDGVPTPRHAAQLLREHGQPPEEWDLLP